VVSRSGAGTVAELACHWPAVDPGAPARSIDQDQFANAGILAQANGALRILQADFTPDRLAAEISSLAAEPERLTAMAAGARSVGRLDAAQRLADLVMKVAGI
jgi:UDP-N-acetylglucosamine--N-acetylmuramyl-(pentapeptide) pyrophosphoryl-undecaprenol N-acetylglucosamine transferase